MAAAAVFVLALIYSKTIFSAIGVFTQMLLPFLIGGAMAFVLNIPMRAIEEKLLRRRKKSGGGFKRAVSLVLVLILLVLLVLVLIFAVVPQLASSIGEIAQQVSVFLKEAIASLETLGQEYPAFGQQADILAALEENWEKILDGTLGFLQKGIGSAINSTIGIANSVISGVASWVISFIFCLYILIQKEKLEDQCRRIMAAYLPEKANEKCLRVCALLYKNFSSFITGQCLEAVILGSMFVVSMTLLRMPYAVLVGILIAFTALLPIVGAFIGCAVGAFLIFAKDPMMAAAFVILFLVLQQVEGNLIYPRVVGSSVGLPAIWVLVAVSLGGNLFGIVGMLVFIPLFSTFYTLLRENVNARNMKKRGEEAHSVGKKNQIINISDWMK